MGFENLYNIHPDGRIYSVRSLRFMKCSPDKRGYKRVILHPHPSSGLKTRIFFLHRLVLIHFVSPPPFARAECNHIDHDPENNHYKNLEWVTHAENIQKSYDVGGRVSPWKGIKRGPISDDVKKKMADRKNRPIRVTDKDGEYVDYKSIQEAADSLGVNRRSINRFLYGKSKSRAGYKVTFTPTLKGEEKEKRGLPHIKSTVINDYNPLKEVPEVDFDQLGKKPIRVAKNLYANKDGYLVKYFQDGELIEMRFKDQISVLNAYGMGKADLYDIDYSSANIGDGRIDYVHKPITGNGVPYESVYDASRQLSLVPRHIYRSIETGIPYKDIIFKLA